MKYVLKNMVLFLSLVFQQNILAQSTLIIPYGSRPIIDGQKSIGEWEDGDSTRLAINANTSVMVYYKHDSANLHIAFAGNLQAAMLFPEILLDINHSQSTAWELDDWWFHVSATDCDYQGIYGNYDSCQVVRPHWTAANNFTTTSMIELVEIQIPFSTIQVDIHQVDTVGLSFVLTNTFSNWEHWPPSANRMSPATWGNAVFSTATPTALPTVEHQSSKPLVYPNPSTGTFMLMPPPKMDAYKVVLYDVLGTVVYVMDSEGSHEQEMHLNVEKGLYTLEFKNKEKRWIEKVLIK